MSARRAAGKIKLEEGEARPLGQELIRYARPRAACKAPEEIALLDDMQLNATGEVDRVTLERMAQERAGA